MNQTLALMRRKTPRTQSVGLVQRAQDESLMPGMWELPRLPEEFTTDQQPALMVRHSITNTNYYVSVYEVTQSEISEHIRHQSARIKWIQAHKLEDLPLTGLARKILTRLEIMKAAGRRTLAEASERP
jgi:A/G-specific adenine glycosylase